MNMTTAFFCALMSNPETIFMGNSIIAMSVETSIALDEIQKGI